MKKTRLKSISAKTKARNDKWADIKAAKIEEIIKRTGFKRCELCGTRGHTDNYESFFFLDPHHVDWNRNNTVYENCCIAHRICHIAIPTFIKTWEDLRAYVKMDEFKKAIANYIGLWG